MGDSLRAPSAHPMCIRFSHCCSPRTPATTLFLYARARSGALLVKYAIEFETETETTNLFLSLLRLRHMIRVHLRSLRTKYDKTKDKRVHKTSEWCARTVLSCKCHRNNLLVPENAFTHVRDRSRVVRVLLSVFVSPSQSHRMDAAIKWSRSTSASLTNINLPLIKYCNCYRNLLLPHASVHATAHVLKAIHFAFRSRSSQTARQSGICGI